MEETRRNKTAQPKISNKTEKCQIQWHWSELPSLSLENIYSYLSRDDQVNMSLVCRKWSEGYGSPSVWKTFKFVLSESQISMPACPGMKFVRKYSNMFQYVEIHGPTTLYNHLTYIWCRHFIDFLQILTCNSQLISVKFQDLLWCLPSLDTSTCGDVKRAIATFLGSQAYLKRVEFHSCFYKLQEYMGLLKQLPENNRDSITHLGLQGLILCDPRNKEQESTVAQSLLTLLGLPSLNTLAIDYSWIFENMFACTSVVNETLKRFRLRALSKLILNYDSNFIIIRRFRGLTSTDWGFLKELYPQLQVEFNVKSLSPSRREVEFLIAPNMPITRLNYIFDDSDGPSFMEINILFDHLLACKTNDHLLSLCLRWLRPIPDLASNFIPFIQACKKLKYFELFIRYPVDGIDLLLESWLETRPKSLKKVIMEISGFEGSQDGYAILKNLTTEYVSRLELVGLNVKVYLHS